MPYNLPVLAALKNKKILFISFPLCVWSTLGLVVVGPKRGTTTSCLFSSFGRRQSVRHQREDDVTDVDADAVGNDDVTWLLVNTLNYSCWLHPLENRDDGCQSTFIIVMTQTLWLCVCVCVCLVCIYSYMYI